MVHKINVNAESNYANSNGKQMTELFKKVSTNSFPVRNMGLRRSSPIALSSQRARGQTREAEILPLRIYNNKAGIANLDIPIHLGRKSFNKIMLDCIGLRRPIWTWSADSDLEKC